MEMLEEFIKELLSRFDFAYMFAVNILTYLLIKGIDAVNGDKAVSTAVKRLIAALVGAGIGAITVKLGSEPTTMVYSFILSLVSWDIVFKPILNKLNDKINYKKDTK